MDQSLNEKSIEDNIEKVEIPVKDIDEGTMKQRLSEYEELTPIDRETINDKAKRKGVIQARFQKWEKSWLQRLMEWTKGIKF